MKLNVKTLKGTSFSIDVKSDDKVTDVKKNIEDAQGADVYPASQQMLIYQGKVLKDDTRLEDNKVAEDSFLVVMLGKKTSSSAAQTSSSQPNQEVPTSAPAPAPAPAPEPQATPPVAASDVYDQAASYVVVGRNMEATIQQILDMGGGSWDKPTITRALRAAYNNPERAVEYLYSGIPDLPEQEPDPEPVPTRNLEPTQPTQPAQPTSGPNSSPLDLFPQGLPNIGSTGDAGTLDFLRNSQQFQALRTMVQANPQILQPMLQELGKQNPQLMGLIQDHQTDFLRLINEPMEGEGNLLNQLDSEMAETINVTPEEQEAIERLEAMGFDRTIVLEVFFACNKNEELAANYLLDHMNEFED